MVVVECLKVTSFTVNFGCVRELSVSEPALTFVKKYMVSFDDCFMYATVYLLNQLGERCEMLSLNASDAYTISMYSQITYSMRC